jgi:hypothetical protein
MKKTKHTILLVTAVAILGLGQLGIAQRPPVQKSAGGPFAVGVTSRGATVAWIVQNDELMLKPPAGAAIASPSLRVEKTTFTGLQPNTRYEYDIASGGDAGKGYFKTAPEEARPYHFVVYGDTRSRHDVHRRVVEQVVKNGIPDFILHTGDLVENGQSSAQWPVFFDIEKELLRQTAFFPSLGNHERNTDYFGDLFAKDESYYSFDWARSHFVVLNSDIDNVSPNQRTRELFWNEQIRWLEEDLQAHQNAPYRFVIAHHPPFTAVSRRQGDNKHVAALVPIFEKYRVSAGFFGHDHNYQHFLKSGIHYLTTGGGGAPLYDVDKPPEGITQKVSSIENFVSIKIDETGAHFQAIAIDGRTVDQFDVR